QNLLALRFGNVMFEPLWNTGAIDHVQITVGETVGLEGRVSYYDGVGALRDMVQNHILQILSIIT
ncbi:MAG TPA: glucose-6-phosphate dehydrogenase, partial [Sphingobium sp.]|nr:glucose-6-phosphate dehydrogenase [Sphingobium sp.]